MKYNIIINRQTDNEEIYKNQEEVPLFLLLRALEKCEIKSFYVELA